MKAIKMLRSKFSVIPLKSRGVLVQISYDGCNLYFITTLMKLKNSEKTDKKRKAYGLRVLGLSGWFIDLFRKRKTITGQYHFTASFAERSPRKKTTFRQKEIFPFQENGHIYSCEVTSAKLMDLCYKFNHVFLLFLLDSLELPPIARPAKSGSTDRESRQMWKWLKINQLILIILKI